MVLGKGKKSWTEAGAAVVFAYYFSLPCGQFVVYGQAGPVGKRDS